MPQNKLTSVENNFTKGLITESTGLNFPENAATETFNCVYELPGYVTRRKGITFEDNSFSFSGHVDRSQCAISTYIWNNVGGDGTTRWMVKQIGKYIRFYDISAVTVNSSITQKLFGFSIDMSLYTVSGGVFDATQECQYADGNGYLFIFHPSCEVVYVARDVVIENIVSSTINLRVRDFDGLTFGEGQADFRPTSLSPEHQYNLQNQGWSSSVVWVANSSTSWTLNTGTFAFTVPSGLTGISVGQHVSLRVMDYPPNAPYYISQGSDIASGVVVSYAGTTLTIAVSSVFTSGQIIFNTQIVPLNIGRIQTFFSVTGFYPSNADIWWLFKNAAGNFDPATTKENVTIGGDAPKGHYIMSPFNQDRSSIAAIEGLTPIVTTQRPTTGTWFQGRIFYAGVNDSQPATGNAPFYTWTENIYFTKVVSTIADFGLCYQTNDPTSEDFNDLLPTDGGVIRIQGCGNIFKLWPTQNGMLIFASNGVWFLTGSQGIGFTATDYTLTKISSIQSVSSTSFVDVQGLPYFWNEEGIYSVTAQQNGTLAVVPITVGTIQTFYDDIPFASKKFARGAYNPIEYTIQWTFRSRNESDVTSRYEMDRLLTFNTYNKAFYPHSIQSGSNHEYIHDVSYVSYPNITAATPDPGFKYFCSYIGDGTYQILFAEEHSEDYLDWKEDADPAFPGVDFESYFITGYKIHGQAQNRFWTPYIYVYSRGDTQTAYKIQGLWDYANSRNSGRWSTNQFVLNTLSNFGIVPRRHRIRGSGLVLQIKISSVTGQPFNIMGWSVYETVNASV